MGFLPRKPQTHKGIEMFAFGTAADFQSWLGRNADQGEGVWLMFAKKDSAFVTVSYEEARELAIRYGWIDGLKNRHSHDFYLIRFTKRRRRSVWSKVNREIAEGLEARGMLHAGGVREVDAARADGRWDRAYDGAATSTVPLDLLEALSERPAAKSFFETISKANRYAILHALQTAASVQTRERRMHRFLAMLESREVPHPDR